MNVLSKVLFILFCIPNAHSIKLVLMINPKSQVKLDADISALAGRRFRFSDELIGYKGLIKYKEKVIPLKFKIHGDLDSHWRELNRSYSVKLQKGFSLMEMREFSIIRFEDKYGNYEVLGQHISKELGLLYRKVIPVDLKVNRNKPAKYLLYEKIIPDALEHNGTTGSFIISFNNAWKTAISKKNSIIKLPYIQKEVSDNKITLSPTNYKIRPKPNSSKIMQIWKKFLNQPSYVYVNKNDFYKYLTIVALTGSVHSVLPDNLRWNYKPWIGKFSPIYYDTIPRPTKINIEEFIAEICRMNYLLEILLKQVNSKELSIAINRNLNSLGSKIHKNLVEGHFIKKVSGTKSNILYENVNTIKKWLNE